MTREQDEWQRDVAGFVRAELPARPCRVLEIGCGDGWLCRSLDRDGYDVHGIDPEAPDGDPLLSRLPLEAFETHTSFDAAVAILSLHHVAELGSAVDRIVSLLATAGRILVVEFAWERFDDATAGWCLDHLPDELDDATWLHELGAELQARRRRSHPLHATELMHRWAAGHGFHPSTTILARLSERFAEDRLVAAPYLYDDLPVDRDAEQTAIDSGQIAAMSLRLVGQLRS